MDKIYRQPLHYLQNARYTNTSLNTYVSWYSIILKLQLFGNSYTQV